MGNIFVYSPIIFFIMLNNKKLGWALILSSFLFLSIPVFVAFQGLYRWGIILINDGLYASSFLPSPMIDFAGSPEKIASFVVGMFVIGILLFIGGIYIIRRSKSQK